MWAFHLLPKYHHNRNPIHHRGLMPDGGANLHYYSFQGLEAMEEPSVEGEGMLVTHRQHWAKLLSQQRKGLAWMWGLLAVELLAEGLAVDLRADSSRLVRKHWVSPAQYH